VSERPLREMAGRIAGQLEIEGVTYQVRKVDGYAYQQIIRAQRLPDDDPERILALYEVAARLVVGLSREAVIGSADVPGLDAATVGRILAVASGGVRALEEQAAGKSPPASSSGG